MKHTIDTQSDTFLVRMTDAKTDVTYFAKAYAVTELGIIDGNQLSFEVALTGSVTDIDGNVYKTVKIVVQTKVNGGKL
ncbi:MAG: hypothetical protein U5K79_02055 [Cyclobacteriaceae bacterium]|nr:hypothetical protein [Cyclobacteriaceae bacterium]